MTQSTLPVDAAAPQDPADAPVVISVSPSDVEPAAIRDPLPAAPVEVPFESREPVAVPVAVPVSEPLRSVPVLVDFAAGIGRTESTVEAADLRTLVQLAHDAAGVLRALLAQVKGVDAQAAQASVHLQERLHLGARMLKAFQDAAERPGPFEPREEMPVARPATPAEQFAPGEFHQQMDAIAVQTQQRIEAMMEVSLDRIKGEIASRQQDLLAIEQRVATMMARADSIGSMVEAAETNLAKLAYRTSRSARHADAQTARLNEVLQGTAVAHAAMSRAMRSIIEPSEGKAADNKNKPSVQTVPAAVETAKSVRRKSGATRTAEPKVALKKVAPTSLPVAVTTTQTARQTATQTATAGVASKSSEAKPAARTRRKATKNPESTSG